MAFAHPSHPRSGSTESPAQARAVVQLLETCEWQPDGRLRCTFRCPASHKLIISTAAAQPQRPNWRTQLEHWIIQRILRSTPPKLRSSVAAFSNYRRGVRSKESAIQCAFKQVQDRFEWDQGHAQFCLKD